MLILPLGPFHLTFVAGVAFFFLIAIGSHVNGKIVKTWKMPKLKKKVKRHKKADGPSKPQVKLNTHAMGAETIDVTDGWTGG